MKKLIAIGTAVAMFASVAPAFAAINSSSITITVTNRGDITNHTTANSRTGFNTADVDVELGCDCPDDINSVTIDATVDNNDPSNTITNDTLADARTGRNTAHGSTGGEAGAGGKVDGGTGSENNGGASAGTGGAGGAGGLGGEIRTGAASSTSGTINLLNTTFVRVRI